MKTPAPPGRPRKPRDALLLPVSLRLNREQLATLRYWGKDWLKQMLDDNRPGSTPDYLRELKEVEKLARVAYTRDRRGAENAAMRRRADHAELPTG